MEVATETIAHHGGDYPSLQSRAMALAWATADSIGGKPSIIEEDFYLRQGKRPQEGLVSEPPSPGRLRTGIFMLLEHCKRIEEGGVTDFERVHLLAYDLLKDLIEATGFEFDIPDSDSDAADEIWAVVVPEQAEEDVKIVPSTTGSQMLAGDGTFAAKQSALNGLLVISLEGGEYAGGAAKMNATVFGGGGTDPTPIRFNQEVGEMMQGALNEVEKYLSLRHEGIPRGSKIEISFQERDSIKDGPSATVACALLLESVMTGQTLDTDFAVTGDMNADGAVQSVGGIDGKLRGAIRNECSHMAIPATNVDTLQDIMILEGGRALHQIQVFSITRFEEALALAKAQPDRDDNTRESMKIFDEVAEVLGRQSGTALLANPHVQERLRSVLELTPNHESARLLLKEGTGRTPKHLSLAGSFIALERCSKPMITIGKSKDLTASVGALKDSASQLRKLRNTLDPRTKKASDSLEDLMTGLTELEKGNLVRGSAKFNEIAREIDDAVENLDAAYDRLRSDPELQEELNY